MVLEEEAIIRFFYSVSIFAPFTASGHIFNFYDETTANSKKPVNDLSFFTALKSAS